MPKSIGSGRSFDASGVGCVTVQRTAIRINTLHEYPNDRYLIMRPNDSTIDRNIDRHGEWIEYATRPESDVGELSHFARDRSIREGQKLIEFPGSSLTARRIERLRYCGVFVDKEC